MLIFDSYHPMYRKYIKFAVIIHELDMDKIKNHYNNVSRKTQLCYNQFLRSSVYYNIDHNQTLSLLILVQVCNCLNISLDKTTLIQMFKRTTYGSNAKKDDIDLLIHVSQVLVSSKSKEEKEKALKIMSETKNQKLDI